MLSPTAGMSGFVTAREMGFVQQLKVPGGIVAVVMADAVLLQ